MTAPRQCPARRSDRSTAPADPVIGISFPASHLDVREALIATRAALREGGIGADCASSFELALAEVMNNIVTHAYHGQDGGMIDLCVCFEEDRLVSCVCDGGKAMPGGRPPEGARSDPGPDLGKLPEGGFGWGLIRALAVDLEYDRTDGRNILRFAFPFPSE